MDAESLDLALATLASIFEDTDAEVLLSSLQAADGDVSRATEALLAGNSEAFPASEPPSKRRKASNGLAGWLGTSTSSKEPSPSVASPSTPKHKPIAPASGKAANGSPARNLNDVLRSAPAETSTSKEPGLPPLTLTTPQMIVQHLPCCSLILDILSKELAAALYVQMVDDSLGKAVKGGSETPWPHNRWYLNDRMVESTHSTTFFVSADQSGEVASYNECAQYWYSGRKTSLEARRFLPPMEEARRHIEPAVHALMSGDESMLKRAGRTKDPVERFPLEYDGAWRANVAAANCYRGSKETVGFHADQLTYLGPYPTIASISLGVTRTFRLRATPSPLSTEPPRTYNIPVPHNSLLIMHPPCQEHYKHTVPPQRTIDVFRPFGRDGPTHTERINITFRFYRPDFRPKDEDEANPGQAGEGPIGTPRCFCGIPAILRADQKGKAAAAASARKSAIGIGPPKPTKEEAEIRFFWQCQAGAQNEGKGCKFFRFLDMKAEKRGPCLGAKAFAKRRDEEQEAEV